MKNGMGFMILCLMMSLVGLVPLAWEWFLLGVTPRQLCWCVDDSLSNWTSAYYSPWSRMDEKEDYPRMFKGGKEDLSCYYGTFRGK